VAGTDLNDCPLRDVSERVGDEEARRLVDEEVLA
jgi:hypothetical protein